MTLDKDIKRIEIVKKETYVTIYITYEKAKKTDQKWSLKVGLSEGTKLDTFETFSNENVKEVIVNSYLDIVTPGESKIKSITMWDFNETEFRNTFDK